MTFDTFSKRMAAFSAIVIFLSLTACSTFYGIKKPEALTGKAIPETAEKYQIPPGAGFILDTAYKTFVKKNSGNNENLLKNHLQPLQLLYFDKSGKLVSYFINCNAGGFPNLKWNRNGLLEHFPPATQTHPDSLLAFNDLLKFIRTTDGKKVNRKAYSRANYKMVVFWSVFMGRQSKRLIEQAKENYQLTNDKSVQLLFVNTDNLFAGTK